MPARDLDRALVRARVEAGLFEARRPVTVGRFAVLERLGAGGMGVVYLAYDPQLDRKVALKRVRTGARRRAADRDAGRGDAPPRSAIPGRERLLREAKALARVNHANVVTIHDVGIYDGEVFIAMEFVDGESLRDWVARQPRRWPEIARVFTDCARGLAAAHAQGLVHRDFKPDNVRIDRHGRAQVLDFGLVRAADQGPDEDGPADDTFDAGLTRTGAIVGTPRYMSPEQFRRAPVDGRTDQFALCVALYEALYGASPFSGRTVESLSKAVMAGEMAPWPAQPSVPNWLKRITRRGQSVDPADRFPTMDGLVTALERGVHGRETTVGDRGRWTVAVAMAVAIAAALLLWPATPAEGPCDGTAARLVGAWDDAAKSRVRTAFAAADPAFANVAWRAVEARLDGYAGRWTAVYEALARTLVRLARAHQMLGDWTEAETLHRRALELRERTLGSEHPDVGESLHALGVVADAQGRLEEAAVHYSWALTTLSRALGARHAKLAALLTDLGATSTALGRYDEAADYHLRARALVVAAYGPDHETIATIEIGLGWLDEARGRDRDALSHLWRAHAVRAAAEGEAHPDVAIALTHIGRAIARRGQLAKALELHRRALTIEEAALGADSAGLADHLIGMARCELDLGSPGRAITALERALGLRGGDRVNAGTAEVRFLLARALRDVDVDGDVSLDRARARDLARTARQTFAALGDRGTPAVAAIDRWLEDREPDPDAPEVGPLLRMPRRAVGRLWSTSLL